MRTLQDFVAVYDNALPADACRHLVRTFEEDQARQRVNGAGVTAGLEDSRWTEALISQHAEPRLTQFFFAQVRDYHARYSARCRLTRPISPVQKMSELLLKRYRPGGAERFQVHFDSLGKECIRYLVFIWYLNDVERGGETLFPDLDVRVAPREGRLVVFPPYWMFQHAGLPPESGDKYILSTYAVY